MKEKKIEEEKINVVVGCLFNTHKNENYCSKNKHSIETEFDRPFLFIK